MYIMVLEKGCNMLRDINITFYNHYHLLVRAYLLAIKVCGYFDLEMVFNIIESSDHYNQVLNLFSSLSVNALKVKVANEWQQQVT